MKIITSILIVFVIISILFPAPIKAAAGTGNTGNSTGNTGNSTGNTGNSTGNTGNVGVTCDARQLQPCLPAITGGGAPSGPCCAKLKEQQTCLCGFAKNPAFAKYISSPNSRKVLAACGVAYPTC